MSRTITLTGLVAAALLAVGASLAHAGTNRGAEATLSGPYIGTYRATLTSNQAIARGDARMAGKFRLTLRRNGTYTATNPLDGSSNGRLAALSGKRLRSSPTTAASQAASSGRRAGSTAGR